MTWWNGRMLGFDLETTGVDPEEARIVTVALASCGGGVGTDLVDLLADPGIEIPEEAAAIHGISTERARAEGQPAVEVVGATVAAINAMCLIAGYPLVGYNIRYDLTVLDRECRRLGVPVIDYARLRAIDPLVIDKHLDRFRKGSRKLADVCTAYGAHLDHDAHDAASDALAACRTAWVLGAKGQVVRQIRSWGGHAASDAAEREQLRAEWANVREDLDLLTQAQKGWARFQAAGLAEYFASQGKPQQVHGDWPVVPPEAPAIDVVAETAAMMAAVEEQERRIAQCHTEVDCARCFAPVGERCVRVPRDGRFTPGKTPLKNPHKERWTLVVAAR